MLYLFDKNENLIHELASSELESLIQHEELNKLMTLEFGVFNDYNDKMQGIEYVAHKDMEDYQKIQMYRIIGSSSDDNAVNYQAVHIIFDELKSYGYIKDKRPDKVKASAALNVALAGSRWKVGRIDDSDLLSTNFYDCTRLDALSKIIKTWSLDLNFYLTFDGNKITGRYIDLLSFRGEDTGERFVYGSNALEVVKEVDKSEVYTRVIPRGKGEEKVDAEGKPTDGYGRRIKIDDVVWEKSKGDPIDKLKGQEFLELKEMTKTFGFSDGEARTRVQIFEDIEDPKELIKAGYEFLVKVSRPLVQFKTKISKRSRTNVGDIVRIIRKDLNFYYRTRIYKAHRNLLNETLEVEFGDKLVQSPADREKIVSDNLNALENRLKETETDLKSSFVDKVTEGITHATFNRDGYNYELKKGNKYGLPAGYYSFDREIDDNPQRVIYVGAGTLAIADSKKSNGDWNFRTFGTGQGFTADLLVAGTILGGKVRWNLEDGTFLIGDTPSEFSMYWDGSTLHLRNVDIDLENNSKFKQLEEDNQLTKEELEQRKVELAGALERIAETRKEMERQGKSFNEEIYQLDEDLKKQIGSVKYDMTNLDELVKSNNSDFIAYKKEREAKDVTLEKELLEIKSNVDITNERIGASVNSLTRSVEAQITETKTYAKNLQGEMKTYTDRELSNYKTYVSNNYASLYQTDKLISASVGEIKVAADDAKRVANNVSAQLQITKNSINQKVSKNEIISEINQSPEQVKIKAEKIDLEGNMTLKGSFETIDKGDGVGIKMEHNRIGFADYRGDGGEYGNVRVTRGYDTGEMAMSIGHYVSSYLSLAYWNRDKQAWESYISMDYGGRLNRRSGFPITIHHNTEFKGLAYFNTDIYMNGIQIKNYSDGVGFLIRGTDSGLVIASDGVYVKTNGSLRKL